VLKRKDVIDADMFETISDEPFAALWRKAFK